MLGTSIVRGYIKIMKTLRWKVSHDFGATFYMYSSLAVVSPILAEFYISASPSRLYNEVLDAHHRASGIKTPRRRVKLAPRVVIHRLDKKIKVGMASESKGLNF